MTQLMKGRGMQRGFAGVMLLALVIFGAAPSQAQDSLEPRDDFNKGGRTSFQFLKIGIGARQASLAEASIAHVRDVNAAFWNPAGVSGIESMEAAFNYTRWLADMNVVAGAIGYRWPGVGVVALSVASLDFGTIPEALVTGDESKDTRTGGSVTGSDLLLGLTYSREFTDRLAIGATVKFVHESMWEYSASNFAFDVGTNYSMGFKGLRLAMSAQNFSGAIDYLGEESDRVDGYDIPLLFRVGVSGDLIGSAEGVFDVGPAHRLVYVLEAINSNDYDERYHFAGEYAFSDLFFVRGGYRFNYEEGKASFGFGLSPDVSGLQVRIDYAYVDYEFLNAPHRLSLTLAY